MPAVTLKGHLSKGHEGFLPRPSVEGCAKVTVGGVPVHCEGHAWAAHSSGGYTHNAHLASGAPHVTIAGRGVGRVGDPISCGDTVAQGCSRVTIGNCGGKGYGIGCAFKDLQRSLDSNATEKDKLLLCIPKIADAMASRAETPNEAQGWLYLRQMMMKWLMGPVNRDAKQDDNPFPVGWDWVMGLMTHRPLDPLDGIIPTSPRAEYEAFIAPFPEVGPGIPIEDIESMEPTSNIYNTKAKRSLGAILTRDGYMRNKWMPFDFITSPWEDWEKKYHTFRLVPQPFGVNGQQAALGSFTLRALARGWTEPAGAGKHKVQVTGMAVFVHDVFNFAATGMELLGFWSCEKGDVRISPYPGYSLLRNQDFRDYQNRHGLGHDYLVLSELHPVADFKGISYVYA